MIWKNKQYFVTLERTAKNDVRESSSYLPDTLALRTGDLFTYSSTKPDRPERVKRAIQRAVAEHPGTDVFGWKVVAA